jgi:hypothetical protein
VFCSIDDYFVHALIADAQLAGEELSQQCVAQDGEGTKPLISH